MKYFQAWKSLLPYNTQWWTISESYGNVEESCNIFAIIWHEPTFICAFFCCQNQRNWVKLGWNFFHMFFFQKWPEKKIESQNFRFFSFFFVFSFKVDPKDRISVENLLSHPWVRQNGAWGPLKWQSIYEFRPIDAECARMMAPCFNCNEQEMIKRLSKVKIWFFFFDPFGPDDFRSFFSQQHHFFSSFSLREFLFAVDCNINLLGCQIWL